MNFKLNWKKSGLIFLVALVVYYIFFSLVFPLCGVPCLIPPADFFYTFVEGNFGGSIIFVVFLLIVYVIWSFVQKKEIE
jgi:hypothetical protein